MKLCKKNHKQGVATARRLLTVLFSLFAALILCATGCGPKAGQTDPNGDGGTPADSATDGSETDGNFHIDAATVDSGVPDSAHTGDAEPSIDGGTLVDHGLADWSWYDQAAAVCDRTSLSQSFITAGYTPPPGSYIMAAEVPDGVDQPAFRFYTWNDTGFVYSTGNFWPASTIKLTAAVGALRTLGDYGLSGSATLTFTDDDGSYHGTVENLYDLALRVSGNISYNRLMLIAGFDAINDIYLVEDEGLPHMVLQRRYTHPYPGSNLRTSPPMDYSENGLSGTIPERIGTGQHPECPNEGNCTTLFEIMEVMRRVTLHDEIPDQHQYPIEPADIQRIMTALSASDTTLGPGVNQALGNSVEIYNKTGFVPANDRLDHALIIDNSTGKRYLIALSLPEPTTTESDLSNLARRVIEGLTAGLSTAPPLQLTSGPDITVQLDDNGPGTQPETRSYTIRIDAPGADYVDVWFDRWQLPAPVLEGAYFRLDHDFSNSGKRLMTVMARSSNISIAYRALTVEIN